MSELSLTFSLVFFSIVSYSSNADKDPDTTTGSKTAEHKDDKKQNRKMDVGPEIAQRSVTTVGKSDAIEKKVAEEFTIPVRQTNKDEVVEGEKAREADEGKNVVAAGEVVGSGKAATSGELLLLSGESGVLTKVM